MTPRSTFFIASVVGLVGLVLSNGVVDAASGPEPQLSRGVSARGYLPTTRAIDVHAIRQPAALTQATPRLRRGGTGGGTTASTATSLATLSPITVNGPYSLLGELNATPPDTQAAVGGGYILEVVNDEGGVYKTDGTAVFGPFSLDHFFPLASGYSYTDPRVAYDQSTGRWYVTDLEFKAGSTFASQVYIAVSTGSNPDPRPVGSWAYTKVFPDDSKPADVALANSELCDQPQMGWSNDKITISCNNFTAGPPVAFVNALTRVLDKADLLAGKTPVAYQDLGPQWTSSSIGSISPARSYTDTETHYVVFNQETRPTNAAGVVSITGRPDSAQGITASETDVAIRVTSMPPSAEEQGTADKIDTGDDRFQGASYRDGLLWTGGNDSCVPSGDTTVRSCLRLVEVATGGMTLMQDFDVGVANTHLFYPGIAIDTYDDLFVGFSTSSSTTYPSFQYTTQMAGEPAGTIDAFNLLQAGQTFYTDPFAPPHRWGDYSAGVPDPTQPGVVWLTGEYMTAAGSIHWGTATAAVTFPHCTSDLANVSPPPPQAGGTTVTVTASASGIGCTSPEFEFFSQPPGGSYSLLRTWGVNTVSWPLPSAAGTAHLKVWARQIGSTATPEAEYVIPYAMFVPTCTFGGLSADKTSPQPLNTAVNFTASPGGCGAFTQEYEFWVYGHGAWTLVQPYSTKPTWPIDYTKLVGYGTYTIDVWIRNQGSTNPYDTYGLMAWVVGGCNFAATLNTSGTTYTTFPGGVACANPEYKVWMVSRSLPWTVEKDWSSSPTFDASTVASLDTGTYSIDVWVRPHGVSLDPNYYETWGLATYIKGGAACSTSAPTLASAPMSPQSEATTVNFTATGCGAGAQYEYWLYPGSGGGWQVLRSYSASPGFAWNTTGLAPRNYSIVVWSKQAGSATTDYDSYSLVSYELGGCTSATLAADKTNPQAPSTTINFTATAAQCANPEYSFWVLPLGGTWQNVQPYSSTATLAWTPSTRNTYAIVVWVRQHGGTTPDTGYESYALTSFSAT